MSVNAYRRAQTHSDTDRALEYRLMNEITAEMIQAGDAGMRGAALMPALHRNREMWSVFAQMCEDDGNALPVELRAGIISLAWWVNRHTTGVISGREELDDLVEVNRSVLQGLGHVATLPTAA